VLKWFDEYYEINVDYNDKSSKLKRLQRFLENRKYISNIKNALSEIKPAAIITTSDMSYSARISRQWASKNNVSLIIIQPSFLNFGESNYNYNLNHRIKYLLFNKILNIPLYRRQTLFGNENKNNYLFLWGDYFKKFYRDKEVYNNIFITGNPVFDKYLVSHEKEDSSLRKILNIPSGERVVTICTGGFVEVYDSDAFTKLLDIYKQTIVNNEDLFFVVKVHPRKNLEKYNTSFEDLNTNNYKIIKNINLYDLYRITDAQVSVMSYSSFEAVVFGIPIVLVNLRIRVSPLDFFNDEIELKANTPKELSKHLRRCLTEEYKNEFRLKRKKYLESRLGYLDEKSGERVVEKVEKIIMGEKNEGRKDK